MSVAWCETRRYAHVMLWTGPGVWRSLCHGGPARTSARRQLAALRFAAEPGQTAGLDYQMPRLPWCPACQARIRAMAAVAAA